MKQEGSGELVMMVVGDVHVNRADPPSIFAHVAPVLRQGDITTGNLEGCLCDRGQPLPGKAEVKSINLRSAPENIRALLAAGFNMVGLANNHNMDYGTEGLLQNNELLDGAKIAHAGGGSNLAEAHKPAILERNGTAVALLSYTSIYPPVGYQAGENRPGLATLKVHTTYQAPENILYQPGFPAIVITIPDPGETEQMLEDVRNAKKNADIVVVNMHWGVSWGYGRVVGYQKEIGRAAIDAGADLVAGAHPHQLMGMEMYKGKLICYCLGNFVLDQIKMPHFGLDTVILKCYVSNKKIQRYSLIPAQGSDDFQPRLTGPEKSPEFATKMQAMSEEFGTTFTAEGNEVVVGGPRPGTPEPRRGMSVLADSLLPSPYTSVKKGK